MVLPEELQEAIKTAKKNSSFGEPSLRSRIYILKVIGNNSLTKHVNEGYYKRAKLALACAYKTLYIWDEYFPNEEEPRKILKEAEKVFSGKITLDELEKYYFQLKTYLDDKFLLGEKYFRGIYAGFSCWAAVGTVLYDSLSETEEEGEINIPPEKLDSSFHSALAISNGAIWAEIGDTEARKEFWNWYFDIAIPNVWQEI